MQQLSTKQEVISFHLDRIISELIGNKKTLATVESCTGGLIAKTLTDRAGSSIWFLGSLITYSNQFKIDFARVSPQTIANFGAVSKEVANEMLLGGLTVTKADYAIAVTGVAGPTGGNAIKPVGTVVIATGNKKQQIIRCYYFANKMRGAQQLSRIEIREKTLSASIIQLASSMKLS